MTNEEKYKTPEERDEAFRCFCDNHICNDECPCHKRNAACSFSWLAREADEELLPCPFCGGDAESQFLPSFRNSYFVRCKICLSSIRGYSTKEDAIAMWNRRVK